MMRWYPRSVREIRPAATTAAFAAAILLAACAVNPATGAREFSIIGQGREIEMGRQSDAQITAAYGLVEDPELQAYVSGIGRRLAALSERPDLPWEFKVVDDPIVNAFALPGGFVYVTRGILARFESEAELAGVLGHEIGHVTARHSVTQLSRQQLQSAFLGLGMAVSETVARYGQVGAAALQVVNLSYSRGDESESDMLGLRYMSADGYDPEEMIGVFRMLADVGGGGAGRLPEWQLTHPYPENREANMRRLIAEREGPAGDRVERDAFLDAVNGMVYGEDPRQGFFRETRFLHPELGFEVTFPTGWTVSNQRTMVAAVSPREDAIMTLVVVDGGRSPVEEIQDFLAAEEVSGGQIERGGTGGVERAMATFGIDAEDGGFVGQVAFLRFGGVTYRLIGYSRPDDWAPYTRVADDALRSFVPVQDRSVLQVQPLRLSVVRLREATSLASYHAREGAAVSVEELARLNRTTPAAVVSAGTRIKTVVGTPVG